MTNPYSGLPASSFWRRAVASTAPFTLDPMIAAPFRLKKSNRVATAGSCFAQNIAKSLRSSGYCYHIAETAPNTLSEREAERRNYGVFSARYGNLYTTGQLLQLFEEAFGRFIPSLNSWRRPDGKFVDPYRPHIEPDGFESPAEVEDARKEHLKIVRHMFETLDVFVFTLGLTEGWRVRRDRAVLPLAPGVSGGDWNPDHYEFINFSVEQIISDLLSFIDRLHTVNARSKVILTVSPVPLIATFEKRHVLASTVYSKSVLRVAAEEAARKREGVAYFPSFEVITSPSVQGRYFASDLRSVTESGVRHVMSVFFRHFGETADEIPDTQAPTWNTQRENVQKSGVVCDEEAIDR